MLGPRYRTARLRVLPDPGQNLTVHLAVTSIRAPPSPGSASFILDGDRVRRTPSSRAPGPRTAPTHFSRFLATFGRVRPASRALRLSARPCHSPVLALFVLRPSCFGRFVFPPSVFAIAYSFNVCASLFGCQALICNQPRPEPSTELASLSARNTVRPRVRRLATNPPALDDHPFFVVPCRSGPLAEGGPSLVARRKSSDTRLL